MYFAYGWPRVFDGIDDPQQKEIIYSSLGGHYLVVVSTTAIQVWSGGQDRVRLGCFLKKASAVQEEGEYFRASWNSTRHVLAILTSENILQLYGIRSSQEELFPGLISQLGRSHKLCRVDIFLSANIHIDSAIRATAVVSDSRCFLVSLSDGRFMVFSWQGVSKGYADPFSITRSPRSGGLTSRRESQNGSELARPPSMSSLGRSSSFKAATGQPGDNSPSQHLTTPFSFTKTASGVPRLVSNVSSIYPQVSNLSEFSAVSAASYTDSEFGEIIASMPNILGGDSWHIWHMDHSEQLHMLVVVLLDGRVALCRTSEHGLSYPEDIKLVRWVCGPRSGSLYACIGARAHMVAVSRVNGQVALFSLTPGKTKSRKSDRQYASPKRILSIVDWGHKPHLTGAVAFMQWSPDCRALAVGWRKQGMAVWSPSGCRLMCSLRQKSEPMGAMRRENSDGVSPMGSFNSGLSELNAPYEPLEGGIASLCWGAEGYQLIIAERGRPFQLLEISFAKLVDGDHRVPRVDIQDSTRLQEEEVNVLQAADRLLLITESQDAAASSNWSQWNVGGQEANQIPEDLVVRHLRVPAAYMMSNWPLIHAAVSADGFDIAAAGSRGLALYSRRSCKWRLFGDVSQERSICTMAVIWLPKIVVACAQLEGDLARAPAELLLYPRYHLDNGSLLGRYALPTIPLALDSVGHYLLVACAPLDIMVLKVDVKGELIPQAKPSASITLLRELSIMSVGYPLIDIALVAATSTQSHLRKVLARESEGCSEHNSSGRNSFHRRRQSLITAGLGDEEEPTHCVVLRSGGLLSVLDMERGSEVLLDNDVEGFWLSGAILSQEIFPQSGVKSDKNPGIMTSSHQYSTSSTSLVNLPSRSASTSISLAAVSPSPLGILPPSAEAQGSPGRKNKRADLEVKIQDALLGEELVPLKSSAATQPVSCRANDENAEYAAVEMPWWAYGARGMQIWYPSSIAEPSTPTSMGSAVAGFQQPAEAPDPELEFDREVYPVGISLADAAIVGVTQRMQKSGARVGLATPLSHANYPLFHPMAESQPVLPCLLRRLLQKGAFDEAVVLARRHARGHYFPRSLEWLLFTSLEIEHDLHRKALKEAAAKVEPKTRFGKQAAIEGAGTLGRSNSSNVYAPSNKLMRKAVQLIRLFPQYSDVVVSVARKTDAALWPLLFSAVGSPSKLVEGLLEANALQSGACCLLCVDRLEGSEKAQRFSLQIIREALEVEQYSLVLELLRFVIPPTDADSIFEAIDAEDARSCEAAGRQRQGTSTSASLAQDASCSSPLPNLPEDQESAGSGSGSSGSWLSWMWGGGGSSNGGGEARGHRTNCTAVITRPLTVVAPPKALPEAPPVKSPVILGYREPSGGGDIQTGVAAWVSIASHARRLLQLGKLRSLAALGRAFAALGDGMPRLLIAARRRTSVDPRTSPDPGSVDLLSALAIAHAELQDLVIDHEAMADAVLLHDSCLAAGYISWAAAFAMLLGHYPTLLELKQDLPQMWAEYSWAVRKEPSFAPYWRVLEAVESEITAAET